MNRSSSALSPIDPERHALEARIEGAKLRIVEDLNRATTLLRGVAARAGRGVGALFMATGMLVVGIAAAVWLYRRRTHVRITVR